jgi:hypothetical protein
MELPLRLERPPKITPISWLVFLDCVTVVDQQMEVVRER